ncbi:DUF6923 family protein [Nonomuraea soli]|uniref:Putative repeat protein (TIGR01451 family)/fimbrial isopeptide formation D2 family protein n=1 Tax=Nonomuraea soli TaxID=1032476 RepID=A0A7W0HQX6_9ACTN|nr:GEVED domain-containing protein [Nonomuraea soli]MBA2892031.1 putative repeat protein (TIGR01451 family)/fimbrial isopeptide formation D2 family protein [Nonomuraea soli]
MVPAHAQAKATPGTPGVPQDGTVLFMEDFENRADPTKMAMLNAYTHVSGATYTAGGDWLKESECNGFILNYNNAATNTCAFLGQLRTLPYALGQHAGAADPATNSALAAFTWGDPNNRVQLETVQAVTNPQGGDRFLTFGVEAAATNCSVSAPTLQFQAVDGTTATNLGSAINACTAAGGTNYTVTQPGSTAKLTIRAGSYLSGALLYGPASFKLRMNNTNTSGTGNDGAIDNIEILDVTPQLDKAFSPDTTTAGSTVALTFTVTNTKDLLAKNDWSFTDTLPAGMKVVQPAATTTCAGGSVTAAAGGGSIAVTGDLNAGQTSCTATVYVTAPAGTYTNGPDNTTEKGVNPPGESTVTFTQRSLDFCSDVAYLMQGTESSLYDFSLTSGTQTKISGPGQRVYNGFGYNRFDGRLYGIVSNTEVTAAANDLAVIDPEASGTTPVQNVNITPALPAGSYNSGDVSSDGRILYVRSAGAGTHGIYMIDVDPNSASFGARLGVSPALSTSIVISDFSFHPLDGMLYAINQTATPRLVRIDPATGKVDVVATITGWNAGDAAGATFMDNFGNLYLASNDTGRVFQVDLTAVSGGVAQFGGSKIVGRSQPTTANDGGACLIARDFGDAPDSYGTFRSDDGASHRLDPARNLLLGTGVTAEQDADTVDPLDAANDTLDDGIASFPLLPQSPGSTYSVTATVKNTTGGSRELAGWIDFNRNGTFDAGERAGAPVADGATSVTLTWTVPADVSPGGSYARFRLGLSADVEHPKGEAVNGEVEDYPVTIVPAALKITKTAEPSPAKQGQKVTFKVTVVNTGQAAYKEATFSDDLSGVLDDSAYGNDAKATEGRVTYTAPALTWTGPLPVGATVTVTYSVTVKTPSSGDLHLVNGVTTTTPGGNCATGAEPGCSVTVPIATFKIRKVASPATAIKGERVTYTITVTNGAVPYTEASFSDDLTDVLDDAVYGDDVAASSGEADYTAPKVNWSGNLAPGQVVTITYSVTIK